MKPSDIFNENAEDLNIGDPVIITGNVQFKGKTGDIVDFGKNKRFVIVNLYNYGKHSFHSSDVSYNDYAESGDEQEYLSQFESKMMEAKSLQSKFEKHLARHGYDVGEKSKYWEKKLKDIDAQIAAWDAEMAARKQGKETTNEDGGEYYYEILAKKVFDENPNLSTKGRADDLFKAGWKYAVQDLGKKRAQWEFGYDEDFPSDFVSAYGELQRGEQGVAEAVMRGGDEDYPGDPDYEDRDNEDEGFFVAIGNEEDGMFLGMVTRDGGRWREVAISGNPPYNWGGANYMSYLSPQDVQQWINKDYGRYNQVEFFDSEEEARDYVSMMSEGITDKIKKGVKSIKRGLQGWYADATDINGEKMTPKDVVRRNKNYDDETLQRLHKAVSGPGPGFPFSNSKTKHSPADLQKRVLDREMKKRGLDESSGTEYRGFDIRASREYGTGELVYWIYYRGRCTEHGNRNLDRAKKDVDRMIDAGFFNDPDEIARKKQQGLAEVFGNRDTGSTGTSKEDKRIVAAMRKKHIPAKKKPAKDEETLNVGNSVIITGGAREGIPGRVIGFKEGKVVVDLGEQGKWRFVPERVKLYPLDEQGMTEAADTYTYYIVNSDTNKNMDGPFDSREEAEKVYDRMIARVSNGNMKKNFKIQKKKGVAEGFLGDREYNRVMPFVKRIASEVSDYDRDEFGEELWSLLDQKYGPKFAQSVLNDIDFYWDTYTELTDQQGVAEGEYDDPRWEPREPDMSRKVDWDIEAERNKPEESEPAKTVTVRDNDGNVVLQFPSTGGFYGDVRYAASKGIDTDSGEYHMSWKRDANEDACISEDTGATSEQVASEIVRRIINRHKDAITAFGPEAIMAVAREVGEFFAGAEELGTSDISIATKYTLDKLDQMSQGALGESASAGGTSAGAIATTPGGGAGKNVGSLFGGSYKQKRTKKSPGTK